VTCNLAAALRFYISKYPPFDSAALVQLQVKVPCLPDNKRVSAYLD